MTLAKFYGVSTEYLLGLTENKNPANADVQALHLRDDAVDAIRDGKYNKRLLFELLVYGKFQQLMIDAEVYVDRIADSRINDMNAMLEVVRQQVIQQYATKDGDLHTQTLALAQIQTAEYFKQVLFDELISILSDIREAYRQDSTTADGESSAEAVNEYLQTAMSCEGSPQEKQARVYDYANISGDIGLSMDIVPYVHEEDTERLRLKSLGVNSAFADKAVAITEKKGSTDYRWQASNPDGYGDWFDGINYPFLLFGLHERKERILNENRTMFASVDDVPDYFVHSSLQVCIRILKRYRDLFYAESDKAGKCWLASVIITTLAAQIANGTQPADVDVLLPRIVEGIDDYSELLQGRRPRNEAYRMQKAFINRKDKRWVIPNPVNSEDNFADTWTDETAQMFFCWVKAVKEDFVDTVPIEEKKYLAGLSGFGLSFLKSNRTSR